MREKKVVTISNLATFPIKVAVNDIHNQVIAAFVGDSKAYLWDLTTGEFIRKIGNSENRITALTVSDNRLAVGDVKGNYAVWSLKDYELLASQANYVGGEITSIILQKGGELLVVGTLGRIAYTSLEDHSIDKVFRGHNSYIRGMDVSDDGAFLLTSSNNNEIKLWDLKKEVLVENFKVDSAFVDNVQFLDGVSFVANGPSVLSAFFDNTILHEEVMNPQPALIIQSSNSSIVRKIVFNHQGNLMANIDGGNVKVWDVKTGFILSKFSTNNRIVNDIQFSNDDRTLIIAAGGSIEYRDPYTAKEVKLINLQTRNRSIHQVELFPDRPILLAINIHGWHYPLVMHTNSGRVIGILNHDREPATEDRSIYDLKISHDGNKIATFGEKYIKIITLSHDGKYQKTKAIPRDNTVVFNDYWTDCIDFSQDDRYISYVSFTDNNYVVVYDLIEEKEVVRRRGKLARFGKGDKLLFMDSDETLALLDVGEDEILWEIEYKHKHMSFISTIAYNQA